MVGTTTLGAAVGLGVAGRAVAVGDLVGAGVDVFVGVGVSVASGRGVNVGNGVRLGVKVASATKRLDVELHASDPTKSKAINPKRLPQVFKYIRFGSPFQKLGFNMGLVLLAQCEGAPMIPQEDFLVIFSDCIKH